MKDRNLFASPLRLAFVLTLLCLPTTDATPQGVTSPDVVTPSYASAWRNSEPGFSRNFKAWADRYAEGGASRPPLAEGIELAKERRVALIDLIKKDPARAIALTVPTAVRRELPIEINEQLETIVSGTGDYQVLGAIAAKGGPTVEAIRRFVEIGGTKYRAYVYGRRLGETTKTRIPLHGVAVDGVMALHEDALRILDSVEAAQATASERLAGVTDGGPVIAAQVGSHIYRFASPNQLHQVEARLEAAEKGLSPVPRRSVETIMEEARINALLPDEASAFLDSPDTQSLGLKKVLIIRVDFSDLPGQPTGPNDAFNSNVTTTYTAAYVQTFMNGTIAPYYYASSYRNTWLTTTVSSAVYRMPDTASAYASNQYSINGLHADARAAASANYNLATYDRVAVLFRYLGNLPGSEVDFGGLADIGGNRVWLNGECDFRVVAHELGHTYGLYHATLWQVSDGNPISGLGHTEFYGDVFDTMGGNYSNDHRTDFNPAFKTKLGWMSPTTVTATGIYRVSRFDTANPTGILALRIPGIYTDRNYWISARRKFTNNVSMQHGAYIVTSSDIGFITWSYLLDMTTPGNNVQDAALAVGVTYEDPGYASPGSAKIKILSEGGTSPNEYIDVRVTIGPSVFDFNSDDNSDYVLYHAGTRQTAVWYLNNNIKIGAVNGPTVSAGWKLVNVADFSSLDGKPDYVLLNPSTHQTAIWYMIGATHTGGAFGPLITPGWELAAVHRFSNSPSDDPSYVLYNPSTGQTAIWYLNSGHYPLTRVYGPTLVSGYVLAGVADFNGDHSPDYVLFNPGTRQTAIWYMSGAIRTSAVFGPTIASGYGLVGIADFNVDGRPDFLLYNPSTRQTLIWYLNNNTYVSQAAGPTLPPGYTLVAP